MADALIWADYVNRFDKIGESNRLADDEYQRHELFGMILAAVDREEWARGAYAGISLVSVEAGVLFLEFHDEQPGLQVRRPGWDERLEALLRARFEHVIRVVLRPRPRD